MELDIFLKKLEASPESVSFSDTMAAIESAYEFTPTPFRNGNLFNEAGQNNGSCKIFSFAGLHGFSQQQTLHCFGDYYRKDVCGNPEGKDHQNIRNFIKSGWDGIEFKGAALKARN